MNRYVLSDPEKCIGCRTCEIACVLAHAAGPIESLHPDEYVARINVEKDDKYSAAISCRHCEDMPCGAACPNNAIVQAKDSIQVIQEKCIGCRNCVMACPTGAMNVRIVKVPRIVSGQNMGYVLKAQAQKCDLCVDSPKGSACVGICPTGSLSIVRGTSTQAS